MKNSARILLIMQLCTFSSFANETNDSTSTFGSPKKLDYCSNPVEATNIDLQWFMEHLGSEWTAQVANPLLRNRIAKWLREVDAPDDDMFSGMCTIEVIDEFDENTINGRYKGFGDKEAHWNCPHANNTNDCKFFSANNVFEDFGKSYISYFDEADGHNLIGNVFCFENGDAGWFASTLSKTITDEKLEEALKHFSELGFDTHDHIKMQSSCSLSLQLL